MLIGCTLKNKKSRAVDVSLHGKPKMGSTVYIRLPLVFERIKWAVISIFRGVLKYLQIFVDSWAVAVPNPQGYWGCNEPDAPAYTIQSQLNKGVIFCFFWIYKKSATCASQL